MAATELGGPPLPEDLVALPMDRLGVVQPSPARRPNADKRAEDIARQDTGVDLRPLLGIRLAHPPHRPRSAQLRDPAAHALKDPLTVFELERQHSPGAG